MGDVLQAALAEIFEGDIELAANILAHALGDADTAGLGERLEPRRDIDALAPHVAAIDDNVADIEAHAELDPPFRLYVGVALGHAPLDGEGAAHGVHDARELRQDAVAGDAHDTAGVAGDGRGDKSVPIGSPLHERAMLVGTDKTAVAGNVRHQDCREAPLDMRDGDDVHVFVAAGARTRQARGDVDDRPVERSRARFRLKVVRGQQSHVATLKFVQAIPAPLPRLRLFSCPGAQALSVSPATNDSCHCTLPESCAKAALDVAAASLSCSRSRLPMPDRSPFSDVAFHRSLHCRSLKSSAQMSRRRFEKQMALSTMCMGY